MNNSWEMGLSSAQPYGNNNTPTTPPENNQWDLTETLAIIAEQNKQQHRYLFSPEELKTLKTWWGDTMQTKVGRPSKAIMAGSATDPKNLLGEKGRLRLCLTEWVQEQYHMDLREFAALTGFSYTQMLYWNQGRSCPTMTSFLLLIQWFKHGDIRQLFQVF